MIFSHLYIFLILLLHPLTMQMDYQVTRTTASPRSVYVGVSSAQKAEERARDLSRDDKVVLDYPNLKYIDGYSDNKQGVQPFYRSANRNFNLLHGDTFELLPQFNFKFDMIFADPPYFLSNDGISVQSGKVVSVNKGEWDRGGTQEEIDDFNRRWISLCREKLKDNGTIWISGTYHNIFSVANCLTQLGFKILNVITWAKTNPPPNVSCRYFTYSTEFIIWARKCAKKPHYYNYELMKYLNDDKQMTDVWRLPAIVPWEKSCGKHPTQKPLALLSRIIMASTKSGAWILDPFAGSSTTGIAANLLGRRFLGIEREQEFVEMSRLRRLEIENLDTFHKYRSKIKDVVRTEELGAQLVVAEDVPELDLPF